ncbi:MAG TPA: porin [Gammaproteobacteria bacterium]|nr:porin [Gammaproteobacteria bacterium]
MNKKLVVTAMSLALAGAAGFANADVKLYGQLDLALVSNDNSQGGGKSDINMQSNQSAVGFKGSEDLGNGLSAFFKVEYQTDIAGNGANTWQGRDQYIGLQMENFGKVSFGSMSTAYKSQGSKIDVAYRSALQSRDLTLQSRLHAGKGENGEGRTVNTIRYDSPSFSGFKVYGTYNFDQNKYDANDDDTYSIGAEYSGGNFYLGAAYIDTQASGPKDTAAAQFVGKYDFGDLGPGALSIHGIYELDKGLITASRSAGLNAAGSVGGANDDGADQWSVGATYAIGNNILLADYGKNGSSDGSDGASGTADDIDDIKAFRIGGIHKLSNRTLAYLGYAFVDPDGSTDSNVIAVGMRHNF